MLLIYPAAHEVVEITVTGTPTSIRDHINALRTAGTLQGWANDWASSVVGCLIEGASTTVKSPQGNGSKSASLELEIPGGSSVEHTLEGSGTATVRVLLSKSLDNGDARQVI
jgi:hypothetical protein